MPIAVSCECGKAFRLKDELAGRKVRCSACNAVIAVPMAEAEGELDADALNMLLTEEAPQRSRPSPPPFKREEAIQSEAPRPAPRMPARLPDAEPRAPKPRRAKRSREGGEGGGYRRIYVSPGVITGVLMMVGAIVWFFGALALGVFFIYPPIMFVLGFIALVKGLLGHEED